MQHLKKNIQCYFSQNTKRDYTGELNSKEYGTDSFRKPHLMQEKLSFNFFFFFFGKTKFMMLTYEKVVFITYSFLKYLEMLIFLIFCLVVHPV